MKEPVNLMITGAAGNLGGILAKSLMNNPEVRLHLMIHNKDVSNELKNNGNVRIIKADLNNKSTLENALKKIDVVIHFAGVLFRHNPEKFLPVTNILYFKNLVDAAIENRVRRVILCSFSHVEGETFPHKPASGKTGSKPGSVHASTRLGEEEYLLETSKRHSFEGVSLRLGMVYGRGILMIDAALFLAKYFLLGIWKKPTWIHLVSKDDFVTAFANSAILPGINGIYHIGDEGIQTLQEFFDTICPYCGYKKPWRMPPGLIIFAAKCCEMFSLVFNTKSPLTRDFITIGMCSYYGDTSRARSEILPELKYKNFKEGLVLFNKK